MHSFYLTLSCSSANNIQIYFQKESDLQLQAHADSMQQLQVHQHINIYKHGNQQDQTHPQQLIFYLEINQRKSKEISDSGEESDHSQHQNQRQSQIHIKGQSSHMMQVETHELNSDKQCFGEGRQDPAGETSSQNQDTNQNQSSSSQRQQPYKKIEQKQQKDVINDILKNNQMTNIEDVKMMKEGTNTENQNKTQSPSTKQVQPNNQSQKFYILGDEDEEGQSQESQQSQSEQMEIQQAPDKQSNSSEEYQSQSEEGEEEKQNKAQAINRKNQQEFDEDDLDDDDDDDYYDSQQFDDELEEYDLRLTESQTDQEIQRLLQLREMKKPAQTIKFNFPLNVSCQNLPPAHRVQYLQYVNKKYILDLQNATKKKKIQDKNQTISSELQKNKANFESVQKSQNYQMEVKASQSDKNKLQKIIKINDKGDNPTYPRKVNFKNTISFRVFSKEDEADITGDTQDTFESINHTQKGRQTKQALFRIMVPKARGNIIKIQNTPVKQTPVISQPPTNSHVQSTSKQNQQTTPNQQLLVEKQSINTESGDKKQIKMQALFQQNLLAQANMRLKQICKKQQMNQSDSRQTMLQLTKKLDNLMVKIQTLLAEHHQKKQPAQSITQRKVIPSCQTNMQPSSQVQKQLIEIISSKRCSNLNELREAFCQGNQFTSLVKQLLSKIQSNVYVFNEALSFVRSITQSQEGNITNSNIWNQTDKLYRQVQKVKTHVQVINHHVELVHNYSEDIHFHPEENQDNEQEDNRPCQQQNHILQNQNGGSNHADVFSNNKSQGNTETNNKIFDHYGSTNEVKNNISFLNTSQIMIPQQMQQQRYGQVEQSIMNKLQLSVNVGMQIEQSNNAVRTQRCDSMGV